MARWDAIDDRLDPLQAVVERHAGREQLSLESQPPADDRVDEEGTEARDPQQHSLDDASSGAGHDARPLPNEHERDDGDGEHGGVEKPARRQNSIGQIEPDRRQDHGRDQCERGIRRLLNERPARLDGSFEIQHEPLECGVQPTRRLRRTNPRRVERGHASLRRDGLSERLATLESPEDPNREGSRRRSARELLERVPQGSPAAT